MQDARTSYIVAARNSKFNTETIKARIKSASQSGYLSISIKADLEESLYDYLVNNGYDVTIDIIREPNNTSTEYVTTISWYKQYDWLEQEEI